jgi:hypothetical protein
MRIALALLLIPFSSAQEGTANLSGTVVDLLGTHVARASVELNLGLKTFEVRTDDEGLYQFSNLPPGEYTLTVRYFGFKVRTIKFILLEREQKRIPDVPLDIGTCLAIYRELVLLPSEELFGRLSGSVIPAAPGVEITLVCRTFSRCGSTKTDSNGRFSFEMLSAGSYALSFRRDGFYPENATGYSYDVNAGWESVYNPKSLEKCRNGNCDPTRRPKPPVRYCE